MKKLMIIAEAGVNHNGDLSIAKQLVDKAAEAGVDYVKFQTFVAKNLVSKNAPKAEYQKQNDDDTTQLSMLKELELSFDETRELKEYTESKGIGFLSTPFDLESADFLEMINLPFYKIPSGEITNYLYLKKIASFKKPLIMSTGMATLDEIECSLELLIAEGIEKDNITVLHCSTEYPTPMEHVNLTAMLTIKEKFGVRVGYSDHTLGIEIPVAATALGAEVIEKHFTLNKKMKGPDHKASLEPDELKNMVEAIRNIESALGDGVKEPSIVEQENSIAARKSIVAISDISKGEEFTENNIGIKRPGNGISPMRWKEVIGNISDRSYIEGDLIREP